MLDVLLIILCSLMLIAVGVIFIAPPFLLAEKTGDFRWLLLLIITIPLMIGLIIVGVECWGVTDWMPFSDCLLDNLI